MAEAKKAAKPGVVDLWKEHRAIFAPRAGVPELVKVPAVKYLMIDGAGDPSTAPVFQESIGALYGLAYTLKFASKNEKGRDFRVMPLSGRFHTADPTVFVSGARPEWRWTLMIAVPPFVTATALKKARTELQRKGRASGSVEAVRLETLREGWCVQLLHVGPYSDERPNIERVHRFIKEHGYDFAGSHHEIYLSDPSRTRPERLKTIIRQPVKKLGGVVRPS